MDVSHFRRKTNVIYKAANDSHSLRITSVGRKFYSDSLSSRAAASLKKKLPRGCFPDCHNVNLLKSKANRYIFYQSSQSTPLTFHFYVHKTIVFTVCVSWALNMVNKSVKISEFRSVKKAIGNHDTNFPKTRRHVKLQIIMKLYL